MPLENCGLKLGLALGAPLLLLVFGSIEGLLLLLVVVEVGCLLSVAAVASAPSPLLFGLAGNLDGDGIFECPMVVVNRSGNTQSFNFYET